MKFLLEFQPTTPPTHPTELRTMGGSFFWVALLWLKGAMAKVPYTKPALSLAEQLALLQSRGLLVADEAAALKTLQHISYYRLGAYWLPFEADHTSHTFKPETHFETVVSLYAFDRALRLLVLDAIEFVEVALRSQLNHQLAIANGPHALSIPHFFESTQPRWSHQSALEQLAVDVGESKEIFIKHWRSKYSDPLPPIWSAVEIMTLGQLSRWFANIKSSADRNRIARVFDCDETNLVSFMHHLTTVRNLCAHHSRLWNREFTFTFKLPRHRPQALVGSLNPASPRYIYNTLAMLACLQDTMQLGTSWKQQLHQLIGKHKPPLNAMGFPANWQSHPLWRI